jgi:hypothetical protein
MSIVDKVIGYRDRVIKEATEIKLHPSILTGTVASHSVSHDTR